MIMKISMKIVFFPVAKYLLGLYSALISRNEDCFKFGER